MTKIFCLSFAVLAATVSAAPPATAEAQIRALEQQWDAATLAGDANALAAILDDSFIETGSDGAVRTKAQVIGAMKSREIQYESAKTEDVKIILHGNAAVVSGQWTGVYTYRGKKVNLRERFTNFYVRRSDRWLCVASHGSSIQ